MFVTRMSSESTTQTLLQSRTMVLSFAILLFLSLQSGLSEAAATAAGKTAGVPYKPVASSFQKPATQSYKPAVGLTKPFTNSGIGTKPKVTTLRPAPTKTTLPKRQFVPKGAPGGNPLAASGSGGNSPPSTPLKAPASSPPPPSPPKKLTPIFNKAAGVPSKLPKNISFQKPTNNLPKKPLKPPTSLKKPFDGASKKPLKPVTQLKRKTGTVYDSIKATQPVIKGTSIPKSFELTSKTGKYWVHPNATKHMAEYSKRNPLSHSTSVGNQAMLTGFKKAVDQAGSQGIKYGKKMQVGRWELIFSKGRAGDKLPVIKHALYK